MRRLCLLGVIASTLLVSLLGCGGGDSAFVSVTGSSRGPAVGGSGNSVIEDTVGDVGTNPAFVDIVKAKVTQIGRDQIVFFMELNAPVRPDNTTLYAWFIDKKGTNDGVLHPGDFSVNLVFDPVSGFYANLTKAGQAGHPIGGTPSATVLLDNLPFEVKGKTVRVIVGHDQLKELSAEGLDAFRFAWWAVTRYGQVTPPNTDRAFDVPPLPGTDLWVYRQAPPAP
jgi:hypothetical protein